MFIQVECISKTVFSTFSRNALFYLVRKGYLNELLTDTFMCISITGKDY